MADTERDGHRVAFNRAFEEKGLGWHWDVGLYGELLKVTGGKERIAYFIDHFLSDADQCGNKILISDLHHSKTQHYQRLLRSSKIPLRAGVRRLILEARDKHIRLAIATTTTPENVSALIESTLGGSVNDWFDVIAAGDAVPVKKPAPDIYHLALARLGLSSEQCVAVEDSSNGLRAAMEAGLCTAVTVNSYTMGEDFTGAALVLDGLGEPAQACEVLAGGMKGDYLAVDTLSKLLRSAI